MDRIATAFLIAAFAAVLTACTSPDQGGRPQATRRFLVVDNGANRLLLVDQGNPARGWTANLRPGPRDLQLVGDQRVLVSHGDGAGEYDLRTGALLWEIDGFEGISSARRLPNGNTLLAGGRQPVTLYEVDREGRRLRTLVLADLRDQRLVRMLPGGNVLIGLAGPRQIVQVDEDGRTVWNADLPGKGYVAIRLPDGRTMGTTGGHCTVATFDRNGRIVHSVGGLDAHPDARLRWFSGFDLLDNNNVVVANWLGHGQEGTGPHVVEFTPDNRLVWQWEDHRAAQRVTNVLVLDE